MDASARKAKLDQYGLKALGAFVPVLLHRADHDPLPEVEAILDAYVVTGASTIIFAALSGGQGYDDRPVLSEAEWDLFFANLDRLVQAARSRGINPTLHHHMGTMIQTAEEIDRLLERSDIGLCLDTGHATIAGIDPVQLAKKHASRVNFVHLKDIDNAVARRVQDRELLYMDALGQGIFKILGQGDAGIEQLVRTLEDAGYNGWYVMEQDTVLSDSAGLAGALNDVRAGLDFLKNLDLESTHA